MSLLLRNTIYLLFGFLFPPLFIVVILESTSKQALPSSPQKIGESHSYSMQSNSTHAQLRPAHGPTPIKHQAHLSTSSAKKKMDTPKKSNKLPKKHQTEESDEDFGIAKVSFEDIMAFFKPLSPCISPLLDLVRQNCWIVAVVSPSLYAIYYLHKAMTILGEKQAL